MRALFGVDLQVMGGEGMRLRCAIGATVCYVLAACERDLPPRAPANGLPPVTALGAIPLGDIAGEPTDSLRPLSAASIVNPYAGDPRSLRTGEEMFTMMNCVGCHGYDAKGGMGPDLTDAFWRYGGYPAQVFNSIYEGRPKGMPAFGRMLPGEAIWPLVTHVQSLGGTLRPSEALVRGGARKTLKGRQDVAER